MKPAKNKAACGTFGPTTGERFEVKAGPFVFDGPRIAWVPCPTCACQKPKEEPCRSTS